VNPQVPAFDALQAQFQDLYQQGDFEAALGLIAQHAGSYPERTPLFTYWQISILSRMGKAGLALRHLQTALDNGIWFSEFLLRKNPALQPLRSMDGFEGLITQSNQLQEEERAALYPLLTLRAARECQGDAPACPLLLGIHANASNAQAAIPFWQPAAQAGWLVALPQSSQPAWKGAYVWDDLKISQQDITRQFTLLQARYNIELGQIVIAGHDMGGEIALWLALNGSLPASAFLAINPFGSMDANHEHQPVRSHSIRRRQPAYSTRTGRKSGGDARAGRN